MATLAGSDNEKDGEIYNSIKNLDYLGFNFLEKQSYKYFSFEYQRLTLNF